MANSGVYRDTDDQYAELLAPTFNPADPPEDWWGVSTPPNGGAVTSIAPPGPDPRQPGSANYSGPQLQRRPAPVAAIAPRAYSMPAASSAPVPSIGGGMPSTVTGALPSGSVPAAASPTGDPMPNSGKPMTWKDSVRAGLVGQLRNADAANQPVASLASQPDLATTTAPLEAQRAQLGTQNGIGRALAKSSSGLIPVNPD